jgi:hypothetical protein
MRIQRVAAFFCILYQPSVLLPLIGAEAHAVAVKSARQALTRPDTSDAPMEIQSRWDPTN